jgi:hypothetical protein
MLLPVFLSVLAAPALWAAADPALNQVKTVYLMPMGHGLDQYLANQIAQHRLFDVVTDPLLADAIVSDRIGQSFEQAFADLYPPPPPPENEEEKTNEDKKDEKTAKAEKAAEDKTSSTIGAALAEAPDTPPRLSSFARGRGNVFIIDRKSKRVLWSEFRPPKNSQPAEVHRTANKIVDQLEDDLTALRQPPK